MSDYPLCTCMEMWWWGIAWLRQESEIPFCLNNSLILWTKNTQNKWEGIIAHEIKLAEQLVLLNNDAICLLGFILRQRLIVLGNILTTHVHENPNTLLKIRYVLLLNVISTTKWVFFGNFLIKTSFLVFPHTFLKNAKLY